MRLLVSATSHIGLVRPVNEDNYAAIAPGLFVVADGMGGHVAGEIASKLAIQTLLDTLAAIDPSTTALTRLEQGIDAANQAVFCRSQSDPLCLGMGTTLTAVCIESEKIYCGHVGDSRLYLFHAGKLRQVTDDHSLVWELARNGSITPEETRTHPQRNILTRAIGAAAAVQIDFTELEWAAGDILMLCTDGLTGMLEDTQIEAVLAAEASLNERLAMLVDAANHAGGLDNITVMLLQQEAKS